ncbi:MAG: branched-chain amino acid ABC transporter permease [Actinomycetota bacterium]
MATAPTVVAPVSESDPSPPSSRPAPGRSRRTVLTVVAIGAAAALPPVLLDGTWNAVLSLALIYSLMGLSVVVLTGFVGQLSLMPASFVGLGAYLSGRLVTGMDTPFWGAAPLAAILVVPAALVIGMVALRLKGLYLAIMTLVFANVIDEFVFRQEWLIGAERVVDAPRPTLGGIDFSSDKAYYLLVFGLVGLVMYGVRNLARSRTARACYAVRDNEDAAQAWGINVAKYKLLAFALSGLIAGFAGALYGHWLETVPTGGQRPLFGLEFSLTIVFFTIVGGVRSIWGPVIGGTAWIVLVRRLLAGSPNGVNIAISLFGIVVLLTMLYRPQGLVAWVGDLRDRLRERRAVEATP